MNLSWGTQPIKIPLSLLSTTVHNDYQSTVTVGGTSQCPVAKHQGCIPHHRPEIIDLGGPLQGDNKRRVGPGEGQLVLCIWRRSDSREGTRAHGVWVWSLFLCLKGSGGRTLLTAKCTGQRTIWRENSWDLFWLKEKGEQLMRTCFIGNWTVLDYLS